MGFEGQTTPNENFLLFQGAMSDQVGITSILEVEGVQNSVSLA